MPQTRPDLPADAAQASVLAEAISAAPDAPPPHRLWATLESAYAPPAQSPRPADDERLVPYLALPMAIALSLVMWIVIVELVLTK